MKGGWGGAGGGMSFKGLVLGIKGKWAFISQTRDIVELFWESKRLFFSYLKNAPEVYFDFFPTMQDSTGIATSFLGEVNVIHSL